jgi:hypothetical protein
MGCRDIIDLIERDPGCILAVIIGLSADGPVNDNRGIGDLPCVFILNRDGEIGTFKRKSEGIILAFIRNNDGTV